MREIKFRGYSINDDKWVYGDLLQYRVLPVIFDKNCEQHECEGTSIGQYAGMKDRNGNEIYEGDLVRPIYERACHPVVFRKGGFFVSKVLLSHNHQSTVEVVGNIYEEEKEIYWNYLEEVGSEELQTSLNFTLGNCPNCGANSTSIILSTQTNNPIWLCNFLCKECHFGAWGRGENPDQAIEDAKEDWTFN